VSKKRSSDGAVGLAARASRVLLVGRDVNGGLRDDAVSLAARASWVLLVGGDVDGDGGRDCEEGIHWCDMKVANATGEFFVEFDAIFIRSK